MLLLTKWFKKIPKFDSLSGFVISKVQSTLSISIISNLCLGPLMDILGYFSFSISNFLYLEQNFWSNGSSRFHCIQNSLITNKFFTQPKFVPSRQLWRRAKYKLLLVTFKRKTLLHSCLAFVQYISFNIFRSIYSKCKLSLVFLLEKISFFTLLQIFFDALLF